MGKLVLHLPDGSTREVPLARERMTIGRRADNDICLPLPTVSSEHAAIVTILDDSFLEDLGSRNGVLVNGKPVTKHFLRDHDEIDIGRQRLVYFSGAFEPGEPAAAVAKAQPSVVERRAARVRDEGEERVKAKPAPRSPPIVDTAALVATAEPVREKQAEPAATIEVLDGASRGIVVRIEGDEFVLGRVGVQVAAIRRSADGLRLAHVEGDVVPTINGAPLPEEGALLATGDEIQVAGTRVRYMPGG